MNKHFNEKERHNGKNKPQEDFVRSSVMYFVSYSIFSIHNDNDGGKTHHKKKRKEKLSLTKH